MLDLFGKITEAGQQLRLSLAESMTSEIHRLRLQLLANAVQLLVPLAPVSDITASLIAPFRKVAVGAGLSYCSIATRMYSNLPYSTVQSRFASQTLPGNSKLTTDLFAVSACSCSNICEALNLVFLLMSSVCHEWF